MTKFKIIFLKVKIFMQAFELAIADKMNPLKALNKQAKLVRDKQKLIEMQRNNHE